MCDVRALLFDVFGTVVDWRSSITRELEQFGRDNGVEADWAAFADDWRALYQPSMEAVRSGRRAWTILDVLHRESLDALMKRHRLGPFNEATLDRLNRAWHRLDGWPDSPGGLTRLKQKFIISTMSNGNTALLVNMAKFADLPWDVILGAETARAYKPLPQSYLANAELLGLEPRQCMMVAAHNSDLEAAAAVGLRTAFVARTLEHGPGQQIDLEADGDWDIVADSFNGIADALGLSGD